MEDFRKSTGADVREEEKVNKERDTGSNKGGKNRKKELLGFGFFFFSRSYDFGVSFGIFGSRIRIRFVGRIRSRVRRGVWSGVGSGTGKPSRDRIGDSIQSGVFDWLFIIIFPKHFVENMVFIFWDFGAFRSFIFFRGFNTFRFFNFFRDLNTFSTFDIFRNCDIFRNFGGQNWIFYWFFRNRIGHIINQIIR